jgi:hypothetical protein
MTFAADMNSTRQAQSGIPLFVGPLAFPIDHFIDHVETLLQLAARDSVAVRGYIADFSCVYAGDLDGVDELTTQDTDWASKILEQAFYTDPLLNFIYGDTINEPRKLNWLNISVLCLYGECFSTAEKVLC